MLDRLYFKFNSSLEMVSTLKTKYMKWPNQTNPRIILRIATNHIEDILPTMKAPMDRDMVMLAITFIFA